MSSNWLCSWGLAFELVYQLLAGGADDEGSDNVRVRDVGEFGALFGKLPNEVTKGLIWLLLTAPEVLEIPRAHVCALEVPDEDPDQVGPVVDHTLRKMLEPRPG
jgi:hypothetical protein